MTVHISDVSCPRIANGGYLGIIISLCRIVSIENIFKTICYPNSILARVMSLVQYIITIHILKLYQEIKLFVMKIVHKASPSVRITMTNDHTVSVVNGIVSVYIQVFKIAWQNGLATAVACKLGRFCRFSFSPNSLAYQSPE